MKKIGLLPVVFLLTFITTSSYSFSNHKSTANEEKPGSATGLSVNGFIHLSATQFGAITGKQMNAWNRLSFGLLKFKLKHELKKDPALSLKAFDTEVKKKHRMGAGWWILIGVFGGILLLILIFAILFGSGWK